MKPEYLQRVKEAIESLDEPSNTCTLGNEDTGEG